MAGMLVLSSFRLVGGFGPQEHMTGRDSGPCQAQASTSTEALEFPSCLDSIPKSHS